MRRLAKINDCIFILALMRNHLIKGRRVSQKNWRCKNMQIFFFLFTSNQISILFRNLILTIIYYILAESIWVNQKFKTSGSLLLVRDNFRTKKRLAAGVQLSPVLFKINFIFFYFCVDKNIISNIKRPVVPFNGEFMSHRFARLFSQSFHGTLMSIDILNCLILISWKIYLKNRFRTPNL